jgi:uncharacterized protein YggE
MDTSDARPSGAWLGKQLSDTLSLLALIASILLGAMAWNEIKGSRSVGKDVENTITVSGEGERFARPDTATFTFAATAEAKVVADAQQQVRVIVDASLVFLREQGIEERDIKTVGYDVYPRYEYREDSIRSCPIGYCPPSGEQVLAGYTVTETISVKIRDEAKVGAILGGVGTAGVSTISGLTFTIEDEDVLKREARQAAIEEARRKAEELAGDLGVRLVRITAFTESGDMPVYARLETVNQDAVGGVPTPQVPAGENRIVSQVSITYEIRD